MVYMQLILFLRDFVVVHEQKMKNLKLAFNSLTRKSVTTCPVLPYTELKYQRITLRVTKLQVISVDIVTNF